jgi:Cysteine dioxygenase type I
MENSSHTETTVTLHVYVPAYKECLTFDERSGHRDTCQVVFHRNLEDTLELAKESSEPSSGQELSKMDESLEEMTLTSCRK